MLEPGSTLLARSNREKGVCLTGAKEAGVCASETTKPLALRLWNYDLSGALYEHFVHCESSETWKTTNIVQ